MRILLDNGYSDYAGGGGTDSGYGGSGGVNQTSDYGGDVSVDPNWAAQNSATGGGPWDAGLLKDVTGLGGVAAGILGALQGKPKTATATTSKLPTWLVPVAIAAVVVLLLLMMVKK